MYRRTLNLSTVAGDIHNQSCRKPALIRPKNVTIVSALYLSGDKSSKGTELPGSSWLSVGRFGCNRERRRDSFSSRGSVAAVFIGVGITPSLYIVSQ